MQDISMFSVPWNGRQLCAIVPHAVGESAIRRLRADDPVWRREDVRFHWIMSVASDRARCQVRNRIKFWLGAHC